MTVGNDNVPILIISCDSYADLWAPFFAMFRSKWPDCPYRLHLGTNHLKYDDHSVNTVNIGDDIAWGAGVLAMLDRLNSDYVIMFLEDFLLTENVQTGRIAELVEVAVDENLGCLRLGDANLYRRGVNGNPCVETSRDLATGPTKRIDGYPGLGVITKRTPYRVATQVAIWRTETLRRLILPGFNIWQFEVLGSRISESLEEPFWSVFDPVVVYDHGVEKGKWKPAGLEICRKAGVKVDLQQRDIFTEETLQEHLSRNDSDSEYAKARHETIESFMSGDRLAGIRHALTCFKKKPLAIQLWPVLLCGLVGPGPLRRVRTAFINRELRRFSKPV